MASTDEDFILILDPDHIPFPEFLDRVLGYFADERVGFVQVSQAYYNQGRSFTAIGAAEQFSHMAAACHAAHRLEINSVQARH